MDLGLQFALTDVCGFIPCNCFQTSNKKFISIIRKQWKRSIQHNKVINPQQCSATDTSAPGKVDDIYKNKPIKYETFIHAAPTA